MRSVIDVAAFILDEYGTMTTMKLQKLAYYSQAYSLSRDGAPLFEEDFQAWMNGPVAPELYREHRGRFLIRRGDLDRAVEGHAPLSDSEKRLVRTACAGISDLSGRQLSEKTHNEAPWRDARRGYAPSEPCTVVIPKEVIRKYYAEHPVAGAA